MMDDYKSLRKSAEITPWKHYVDVPFEEDISALQRKACRGDRNAQRDLQLAQSRLKRRKK